MSWSIAWPLARAMAVWEYEAAMAEWHLAQASVPGGVVAAAGADGDEVFSDVDGA
jgi:hypothetical protein